MTRFCQTSTHCSTCSFGFCLKKGINPIAWDSGKPTEILSSFSTSLCRYPRWVNDKRLRNLIATAVAENQYFRRYVYFGPLYVASNHLGSSLWIGSQLPELSKKRCRCRRSAVSLSRAGDRISQ